MTETTVTETKQAEEVLNLQNFSKVVRPGNVKHDYDTKSYPVYCKIEFTDGRLSISGVEGPYPSGNCAGSCGQINPITDIRDFAPGWDRNKLREFNKAWANWHLNNMRAGCEHQRANWDLDKEVSITHYELTIEAIRLKHEVREQASKDLASTGKCELTPDQVFLYNLEFSTTKPIEGALERGYYKVKKVETKKAHWTNQSEHPDGILSKPCEVCGYKYGSRWLTEEVPQAVIDFLRSLPDTDKQPAWV